MTSLNIRFNKEKTPGQGEDADPVLLSGNGRFFLGVFDGMGGAGSTVYEANGEQRTGAYLASRAVSQFIGAFFLDLINDPQIPFTGDSPEELSRQIHQSLQLEFDKLTKDADTKLKSRLLKPLPTTFAGLFLEQTGEEIEAWSLWAGDSRNFLLTSMGLQQLSADDLKFKYDPLENLKKDSPLENVISAEGDFKIRSRRLKLNTPCVLFSVTDGCYGYFSTPMQFELTLLQALESSGSVEQWSEQLIQSIGEVAGDDFSMALVCLGYFDFPHVQQCLRQRMEQLDAFYVRDIELQRKAIDELRTELKQQEKELTQAEIRKTEAELERWNSYKGSYLQYIESFYEERG